MRVGFSAIASGRPRSLPWRAHFCVGASVSCCAGMSFETPRAPKRSGDVEGSSLVAQSTPSPMSAHLRKSGPLHRRRWSSLGPTMRPTSVPATAPKGSLEGATLRRDATLWRGASRLRSLLALSGAPVCRSKRGARPRHGVVVRRRSKHAGSKRRQDFVTATFPPLQASGAAKDEDEDVSLDSEDEAYLCAHADELDEGRPPSATVCLESLERHGWYLWSAHRSGCRSANSL